MISYEEARERVRSFTEPGWDFGTYCLDDRMIVENDELYVFNVGAREYIVDDDDEYELVGAVPIVRKRDGTLGVWPTVLAAVDPTMRRRPNPRPTFTC
jgi:hypothetical protein